MDTLYILRLHESPSSNEPLPDTITILGLYTEDTLRAAALMHAGSLKLPPYRYSSVPVTLNADPKDHDYDYLNP